MSVHITDMSLIQRAVIERFHCIRYLIASLYSSSIIRYGVPIFGLNTTSLCTVWDIHVGGAACLSNSVTSSPIEKFLNLVRMQH